MACWKIQNKGHTRFIGHRGFCGMECENTVVSFVAAANRSLYGIETDVHVTADGRYIIIHDNSTLRTTGEAYDVEKTDFATLRSLRAVDPTDHQKKPHLLLPTLEEYIDVCKKYEKESILELKTLMIPNHIRGIVETIRDMGHLEHTTFISFSLENLLTLKRFYPEQPAQLLTDSLSNLPALIQTLRAADLDLDVHYSALNQENVDELHAAGIQINTWTVNSPEDATRLIQLGVDFITSNTLE